MALPHVVVVGAGLAGLAAAHRLRDRTEVTLLERDLRIGGRVRSEWIEGFTIDAGSQLLTARDATALRLLDELGLRDEPVSLSPAGREQIHRGLRHPVRAGGIRDLARIRGLRPLDALRAKRLARLLRRFGPALDPAVPERAAPHDDRSVDDFCRLYFGASTAARWAAPFLSAATLCDPRETSRALLLRWATQNRLDADPCSLRSGLSALGEALCAGIEPRLGIGVESVERGSGGLRVRARATIGGFPERVDADAVVLALPAPGVLAVAAPLLEPAERDFHAGVRYDPAVAVAFAAGDRIERATRFIQVPRAEGWPIETLQVEVADESARVPEACALIRARATAAFGAAHLGASDDAIWKRLGPTIDRVYPDGRDAELVRRVFRDPNAFPRFPVGHYRALRRFARAQADQRARGRRLYFAGDHLFDPSLEGALAAGERAARDVLADLGLAEPARAVATPAAPPP